MLPFQRHFNLRHHRSRLFVDFAQMSKHVAKIDTVRHFNRILFLTLSDLPKRLIFIKFVSDDIRTFLIGVEGESNSFVVDFVAEV